VACQRSASTCPHLGPPIEPAEERLAEREQGWPAVGHRGVEQQRAALILVALAGRPQSLIEQGG
jgi:hypothetical protein